MVSLQSFIVGVHHPLIAFPHPQSLPYGNTIARPLRSIRSPTHLSFVCHTPYNIGDVNIVERPSSSSVRRVRRQQGQLCCYTACVHAQDDYTLYRTTRTGYQRTDSRGRSTATACIQEQDDYSTQTFPFEKDS